mgnify:CR=1 FL=1
MRQQPAFRLPLFRTQRTSRLNVCFLPFRFSENPTDRYRQICTQTAQWLAKQPKRPDCRIETLQTRNADSLDFHDTAVWCLKDALEAAFKAGGEFGV